MGCFPAKQKPSQAKPKTQTDNIVPLVTKPIKQVVEMDKEFIISSKFTPQVQSPQKQQLMQLSENLEQNSSYLNQQTPTKKMHKSSKFSKSQSQKTIVHTATCDDISLFYTMGKTLGDGAFGQVKQATSKFKKNRKYAIKIIKRQQLQERVYLLRRELEILIELDHPNIIEFYEIYIDEQNIYLVMELCESGDLYSFVQQKGIFSEENAKNMIIKLLSILKHMHHRQVLQSLKYRDVDSFKFPDDLSTFFILSG